ncbi:MAG: hypothetical protein ACREGA_00210 [Candidatus Saccharimonadales bacterium]
MAKKQDDSSAEHVKYFDDQFDDEEVLYVFRKHPLVMRKGLILGLLPLVLGALPSLFKPSIGFGWFFGGLGIGLGVGIIVFLPFWISWHYSVFIVTSQRLVQITQKGLFHRGVVDMALHQIQMVNYEISGLQETLLGFGTVMLQTMMGDLVIHYVHHPAKTQKRILEILRQMGVVPKSYQTPGGQGPEIENET